jgi:hypothetical protein
MVEQWLKIFIRKTSQIGVLHYKIYLKFHEANFSLELTQNRTNVRLNKKIKK